MRQKKIYKDSFEFVLCWPTAAGHGTCLKVNVSPVRFLGETDFSFPSGCQLEIVSVGNESSCLLPHLRAGTHLLDVCTPMHTASDLLSLYCVSPLGLEDTFLGIIHLLWSLESLCLLFLRVPWGNWALRWDLMGTFRLGLSSQRSLILCTLSSYASLY